MAIKRIDASWRGQRRLVERERRRSVAKAHSGNVALEDILFEETLRDIARILFGIGFFIVVLAVAGLGMWRFPFFLLMAPLTWIIDRLLIKTEPFVPPYQN